MTSFKKTDNLLVLHDSVISTHILIQNFEKALETPNTANSPPNYTGSNPTNPLALLADASTILKVQITKISLLILNKPFTPTAISSILTSLSNECLPALMSVFELCPPIQYSHLLNQSIRTLLFQAFSGLRSILATIPQDEDSIDKPRNHSVLALTGALWETCNNMAELSSAGLVTLAVEKIEVYRGLLEDAIEELEDWDPDEDTDDDNSTADFPILTPDPSISPTSEILRQLPKPPTTPIPLALVQTLALLRHLHLLYPAFTKWRLRTFPPITSQSLKRSPGQAVDPNPFPSPTQISSFNTLIKSLLEFSERADEIAEALYSQDGVKVSKLLISMKKFAVGVVDDMRLDWNSIEDNFSEWFDEWKARLDAMSVGEPIVMSKNGNNEKSDGDCKSTIFKKDVNTTSTSTQIIG